MIRPEPASRSHDRTIPDALSDGGEMGALMRSHDWATSPLGFPGQWSQSLRTVVSLLLNSKFPMFVAWGPELAFLYNDGYRPIFGAKHPAVLGRPFAEVWPEIWDDIRPYVERALAGEATFHENLPLTMVRNGYPEEVYFTFSYSPVRDETGAVAGMFCACTETTEKVLADRQLRQAEAELRETNKALEVERELVKEANGKLAAEGDRLRELFRQAPGFMAVVRGPDHVFEFVNDAYLHLVGRRDIEGKTVYDALPEVAGQGFFELLDKVRATGEPFVGEGVRIEVRRRPDADPEERFVNFVYQPIKDAEGRISGIFVEGSDLTEAKRAEEALRASQARLDAVVRHAPVAILLAEAPSGRIVLANAWVERIFGRAFRAAEDISEYTAYNGFHASDGRPLRPKEWPLARAIARGEIVEGEEIGIERGDGTLATISMSAAPIRDGDGRVAAAVAVFADMTEAKRTKQELQRLNETLEERVAARTAERERAEAELRHAQKMEAVGQLTGGVAHDFNNLLQALTGCLQMIERRAPTPQIQPLVEAGQQAIDRGARLVQQLMAFARRQNLRPEPVDVRDRILGMSELLARALRADISLETMFEPDLWPVEVDPTQLELAVINLAVNARDAMPHGGRLRIEMRNVPAIEHTGDMVCLSMSDSGSGMSPDVLTRAFEPFFTTKEVGKGSGLGLAQVYGFARQSGGRVEIESEPARGTRVSLFLPRTTKPIADLTALSRSPGGVTQGVRVLLVEDDPIVGNMVAAALEDVGYRVVRTAHAVEALSVLSSGGRVDLLFSDVVMPGDMSGLDLAREAHRLRPGLPVVLTTGYSEEVARAKGVRVLRKPYRIAALVETLEAALGGESSPA